MPGYPPSMGGSSRLNANVSVLTIRPNDTTLSESRETGPEGKPARSTKRGNAVKYIVFYNMTYRAWDTWRQESYSELVEASDEDSARMTAGELIVSSLGQGETAELTIS